MEIALDTDAQMWYKEDMDAVGSYVCGEAARASALDQAPAPPPRASVRVCEGCPVKAELFALRHQHGYYKKMHERACEREKALKEKVEELTAKLQLRERQLFARKSERRSCVNREGNPRETADGSQESPRTSGGKSGARSQGLFALAREGGMGRPCGR